MVDERHFMEIGIYWCEQDAFHAKYNRDLKKRLDAQSAEWGHFGQDVPEESRMRIQHDFWKRYVMPWQYNQVTAWLSLYVLGNQIRGELWKSDAKHFRRDMLRRQIYLVGKAFEMSCWPNQTSADILTELRNELAEFQKSYRKGKAVLDLECFDNIGPYIDWRGLTRVGALSR
jgi:hypothetical protein